MSSQSVVYEKDVRSEDQPSQRTTTKIQAVFQIAHPAPKFSLCLAPKKLLQIQLAQNHRPVPVLEIWKPLFRKPKLSRDFHQKVKLRAGDVYATIDESYITTSAGPPKDLFNAEQYGDGATSQENIVAAMCQSGGTTSNIHFRDTQCSWQASVGTGPAKSYRFIIKDKNRDTSDPGRMTLQWEKRSEENVSASSLDAEQFVLLLNDRGARQKSRIATMTPDGFEIIVRKSSILEDLQKCGCIRKPLRWGHGSPIRKDGSIKADKIIYNLPIYFQAIGRDSSITSGIKNIPTIFSTSIATFISFISSTILTKVGYHQPFLLAGSILATIGAGLIYTFDLTSGLGPIIGYQILYGIDTGLSVQIPVVVAGALSSTKDQPITTATVLFFRSAPRIRL